MTLEFKRKIITLSDSRIALHQLEDVVETRRKNSGSLLHQVELVVPYLSSRALIAKKPNFESDVVKNQQKNQLNYII